VVDQGAALVLHAMVAAAGAWVVAWGVDQGAALVLHDMVAAAGI
jgi:hypothetical protein